MRRPRFGGADARCSAAGLVHSTEKTRVVDEAADSTLDVKVLEGSDERFDLNITRYVLRLAPLWRRRSDQTSALGQTRLSRQGAVTVGNGPGSGRTVDRSMRSHKCRKRPFG
jgi:hypothetical protein